MLEGLAASLGVKAIGVVGVLVAVAVAAWFLHRGGRRAQRIDNLEETVEIREKQLDKAINTPTDRPTLIEILKDKQKKF